MKWNWQLPDWPKFSYDPLPIVSLENEFLKGGGGGFAILKHLEEDQKKQFIVELLSIEGQKSAEIEGEILKHESLQASIQRHFGIDCNQKNIPAKEQGMGQLMWQVYDTYQSPLTHETLFEWHKILMQHDSKLSDIGKYRFHTDPMQIIAGRLDKHIVHFEAPPSSVVFDEMTGFIKWFNESKNDPTVSALARAAIAHVYFESIHPFEDGNGRIGRALVEKALSQSLNHPTLIAISSLITQKKREYYAALGTCNQSLNIQKWICFFSQVILQAQQESLKWIHFLMAKTRVMNRVKSQINPRQEKVLLRMFAEGVQGFAGGLSAENYVSITKTSKATVTRDLADLVEKEVLYKTGHLKHTRYWLNI